MLCIDPYYTALPGSPVSYAYYGRHPVLRIPITAGARIKLTYVNPPTKPSSSPHLPKPPR